MKKIKKYNGGGPTTNISSAAGSAATSNSSSSQRTNVDAVNNKAMLDEIKKQKEPKKQNAPTPTAKPIIMAKKGGAITSLNKVQEMYSKKKK